MKRIPMFLRLACFGMVLLPMAAVMAQQPYTSVTAEVNKRMVKLYGAGGFKGLPSYGTGILVSPKGFILTVNNHILSSSNIRVHVYDGRQFHARVLAREPELDVALLKIDDEVDFLPAFDFAKEASQPLAETGAWILAFSNQFQIATRDEPMSVQRGVIAAYAELRGKRGHFDAPFSGEVYFLDCVANNPGAAGGIVTTRKGELLGIVGRELKNALSDTWVNYAVPIQATVDITRQDQPAKVSMTTFIKEAMAGAYKQSDDRKRKEDKSGYHGITLVANAVSTTPPYVEEVNPGSPASKAGLRPDVYVEGELVTTIRVFRDIMKTYGAGDEIKMEIQRGNRLESVKLKLENQPKSK